MAVPTWVWIAGGAGALWYINEQNRVKLAANRGAEQLVNRTTNAAGGVIDEAGSALGRFFGGLFGGGSNSSSSSSSGGNDASYGADTGYSYRPDQYGESAPSWGDSDFTG